MVLTILPGVMTRLVSLFREHQTENWRLHIPDTTCSHRSMQSSGHHDLQEMQYSPALNIMKKILKVRHILATKNSSQGYQGILTALVHFQVKVQTVYRHKRITNK